MNAKQRRKARRRNGLRDTYYGEAYDSPVVYGCGIPGKLFGITATDYPLWKKNVAPLDAKALLAALDLVGKHR